MYKKIIFPLWLAFLAFNVCSAEVKTYEGIGEYLLSDFETVDMGKARAKSRAMGAASEQAGVYVKSFTRTKNMEVAVDEVTVIASNIISVTEITYERINEGDMTLIRARVKADIDTDNVIDWLEKGTGERGKLTAQKKELLAKFKKQEEEITALKKRLAEKPNALPREQMRAQILAEEGKFLSMEKINEGYLAYYKGDLQNAVKCYTEAAALWPENDMAYRFRGSSFFKLGNFKAAGIDYDKSVELAPKLAAGYVGRGAAYIMLKDYKRAARDFGRAIELDPKFGEAYYNRSICRAALGDKRGAAADYAQAKNLGVS